MLNFSWTCFQGSIDSVPTPQGYRKMITFVVASREKATITDYGLTNDLTDTYTLCRLWAHPFGNALVLGVGNM